MKVCGLSCNYFSMATNWSCGKLLGHYFIVLLKEEVVMTELYEILKFIEKSPKSWKELKDHFDWNVREAQYVWDIYFDDKTKKYVYESSERRSERETISIWFVTHEGKNYIKENSSQNRWLMRNQLAISIVTVILSIGISTLFSQFIFAEKNSNVILSGEIENQTVRLEIFNNAERNPATNIRIYGLLDDGSEKLIGTISRVLGHEERETINITYIRRNIILDQLKVEQFELGGMMLTFPFHQISNDQKLFVRVVCDKCRNLKEYIVITKNVGLLTGEGYIYFRKIDSRLDIQEIIYEKFSW